MRVEVHHYCSYEQCEETQQQEKETNYFLLPNKAYY